MSGDTGDKRTYPLALCVDGLSTAGPALGARGGRCNLKANRIPDRSLGVSTLNVQNFGRSTMRHRGRKSIGGVIDRRYRCRATDARVTPC